MPLLKLRDLSKYGIIADLDPFDLPPQAFSAGVNARFRNGRVTRGPVFRLARVLSGQPEPRYVFSNYPSSGLDNIYVGFQDGRVELVTTSSEADVSPAGFVNNVADLVWTSTHLADVIYVNREDRPPWYMRTSDATFFDLSTSPPYQSAATTSASGGTLAAATYYYKVTATNSSGETNGSNEQSVTTTGTTSSNTITWSAVTGATGYRIYRGTAAGAENVYYVVGAVTSFVDTGAASTSGTPPVSNTAVGGNWDPTWKAKLLRTCGGALVALNITKGTTAYPTMVKTSSFPTEGSVPASWDATVPTSNATENIIAELDGPIVDACTFGANLIIYGHRQAYLMQKVTGQEIFDYYKLPFQKGAMSANCSVEIDGTHYVFGIDDIWVHDGTSERSLVDGLNKDFIFSSINTAYSRLCFVTYNANLKEIHFCYPSGDKLVSFRGNTGCNRQAVYNLVTKTWTFDDLPFVYAATSASLGTTATYATVTTTYATAGGSYQDQEGSLTKTLCYVGESSTTYTLNAALYAFDIFGAQGSTVNLAVDTNATKGFYLERDGIDLHSIDPTADLTDYTQINTIYPLARSNYQLEPPISFTLGSSDYYGQPAIMDGGTQTFDGYTNYKLDFNSGGRYLSLQIAFNDYNYISISGLDVDVIITGGR